MKYEVDITRVSYANITFSVEANSQEEAKELALDQAYNTGWCEDSAEYEVNSIEEVSDED